MLYVILFILVWLPFLIFFPVRIKGKNNLPKKQGAVFVCNHYSNLDPLLLNVKLAKKIRYMAKKELFKTKFSAWLYKKVFECVPVDRGVADISAIKSSLKILKENKILGIFPEGTRNKTGQDEMTEIHGGAIMIASRAGVPIVPAIIYKRPKIFRLNTIVIGEPYFVKGENPNKLTEEEMQSAVAELAQKMADLRAGQDAKKQKKTTNADVKE